MASPDIEHFDQRVQEFKEITGADDNLATQMLRICNGDLEMAINMHVDGGGIDIHSDDTAGPPRPPRSASASPRVEHFSAAAAAASAAGNFDAGPSNGGEYVRPPLPPKKEVLVESFSYGSAYGGDLEALQSGVGGRRGGGGARGGLVDPFRDLHRETQLQEEQMERAGGVGSGVGLENLTAAARKVTALEDLFRPPLDLMFKGTLDAARDEGRRRNKWILVNIVNASNFQCQTLNRDVWSSEAVKDIVKNSFIFWQVYSTSDDGAGYIRFYPVSAYPHVAILDPRTGERQLVWSKLDACTFAERVTDFLTHNPCPDRTAPPVPAAAAASASGSASASASQSEAAAGGSGTAAPPLKRPKSNAGVPPVDYMDEDEQMKAAIAASLQDQPAAAGAEAEPNDASQTAAAASSSCESYTKYLGSESDPKSELMFRYPDGERRVHSFPSTSRLRALTLFAHEQGFPENSHELVTNYPRRNLSELDSTFKLSEVGLFPKETIFIQLRSA